MQYISIVLWTQPDIFRRNHDILINNDLLITRESIWFNTTFKFTTIIYNIDIDL